MALKSVYTEVSEVPENLSDFYQEDQDGRFVLQIADIDAHPKVRGVITANNENKRKAQERLSKLEQMESRLSGIPEDFDADEWERLKTGNNLPEEQLQSIKDQHAKAVAGLKNQYAADIETINAQLAERDGYIDGLARKSALDAALDEAGFDPAHKPMVSKFLADQIKVKRADDGSRVAFAETDLGDISAAEFVREFAAKDGKIYLSKASGPAAQGGGNGHRGQRQTGDFGGDKNARLSAIKDQFPDLK